MNQCQYEWKELFASKTPHTVCPSSSSYATAMMWLFCARGATLSHMLANNARDPLGGFKRPVCVCVSVYDGAHPAQSHRKYQEFCEKHGWDRE